ncbi:MAG: hypothetical protein JXO22_09365 [Phycisphaerae bacterium]|nr:hypothetical protein [Phycisphaerae bacterium]
MLNRHGRPCCCVLVGLAVWAAVGGALAGEPLDLVPADSMLAWYGRPLPDALPPEAGPSPLNTLIDTLPQLAGGRLDRTARVALRVFQTLGQMIRYRHAVVLIDSSAIHAGVHPASRRVDDLRLAMIIDTQSWERSGPFRRIMANAIEDQTDSDHAAITDKTAERWSYRELYDERLPAWCRISWGQIDEYFVMTLGADVWPVIASVAVEKQPSLARDEWVTQTRDAQGRDATIEIFLDADRMRERLDPLLNNWISDFFKVWDAGEMHRGSWAIGLKGDAIYCLSYFKVGGETVKRVYADANVANPGALGVPAGSRYAVYKVPAAEYLVNLVESLYVWQTPEKREHDLRRWERIQREHGFDAQRDVLDHLGDTVVLHNYPRHPLRLPVFFTTLIEIRDEPETVRKTIDTMCEAWQQGLEKEAEKMVIANPAEVMRRDGVWYIQVGPLFSGLAWTVTDRYIVVSWSPTALREYLEIAGDSLNRK